MRFTDIFIHRPVLAIVLNLVIVIAGLQAIRTLNVRQYPKLESATITVQTVYVGANAELVRGFITAPLERSIAAADGIDYIESQSVQGMSTINVRLRLNFPAADALADVSARVAQVRADLPPEAEVPTITIEPSDAQVAAMYLAFGSDILQDNQVTDYLIRVVQPRLSSILGVQRAEILGARTFALRAWLKPERMAALNVSPGQVRAALAANNYLAAVGETKGHLVQLNLTTNTDLHTVDQFRRLVVHRQDDTLVRLEDIADVVLGADTYEQDVRFTGKKEVFMGVWVLPNANSLDVIADVRRELETIQADLPTGMRAAIAFDSTVYIDSAVHEVVRTLSETVLIVMVVIFLFLGSLRTAFVPVVAIPLSLIGAVFLMQAFGFTINLLTLLAIVLSVGLVVDDAIVVVENVERNVREGRSPMDAALVGARELIGPVIAMTFTLAAVYAPIGFQGGLTGALFREFAFTLAGNRASLDLARDKPGPGWDFQAGPVAVVNFNRSSTKSIDDPRIKALGKVDTAIELGGYVGIGKTGVITSPYDKLSVSVSYRHDVSGSHDSAIWQPTINYLTPLNRKTAVGLFASAEHAGKGYARTYFGITPGQSAASGLPAYAASSGWKNYTIGTLATYALTGDLLHGVKLVAAGTYRRMLGDFGDSPVVSIAGDRDQWMGAVGLAYTF